MQSADFYLSSYDYELPEEIIARYPPKKRGDSRLLLVPRQETSQEDFKYDVFSNLSAHLPENAVLVLNNTRVLPARMHVKKQSGGKAQFMLLTPLPLLQIKKYEDSFQSAVCEGLVRPLARVKTGEWLSVNENFGMRILEKNNFGRVFAELRWQGDLEKLFMQNGEIPLPPYLGRPPEKSDQDRYQTVFANSIGAVAAPTAGLHFTADHLAQLRAAGFEIVETTLHVGYGTFTPVRCENITLHDMHAEYVEVSQDAANSILKAKREKKPVIAVGTTSLRALEGMWNANGKISAFYGWTNIFIYPGKQIHVADGLITNFHLPRSSLLMLVASLTGRQRILKAYEHAIKLGFHFFSYGDAMLII